MDYAARILAIAYTCGDVTLIVIVILIVVIVIGKACSYIQNKNRTTQNHIVNQKN